MLSNMEQHIVKHDVGALEGHLVSTSDVLSRMENLEERRGKILSHLLRAANLRVGKGVIDRLVELAQPSIRDELQSLRGELKTAGYTVRSRSNRNGLLARNAIEINDEIVRGLFAVDAKATVYDRNGGKTRHSELILNRSI